MHSATDCILIVYHIYYTFTHDGIPNIISYQKSIFFYFQIFYKIIKFHTAQTNNTVCIVTVFSIWSIVRNESATKMFINKMSNGH